MNPLAEKLGMRVLSVGARVSGLTLAAKRRQQGHEPGVIECLPSYADPGYGISLWPLGSCVLQAATDWYETVVVSPGLME
jgi:hypothetical protein